MSTYVTDQWIFRHNWSERLAVLEAPDGIQIQMAKYFVGVLLDPPPPEPEASSSSGAVEAPAPEASGAALVPLPAPPSAAQAEVAPPLPALPPGGCEEEADALDPAFLSPVAKKGSKRPRTTPRAS